jgi:hypothetical protein
MKEMTKDHLQDIHTFFVNLNKHSIPIIVNTDSDSKVKSEGKVGSDNTGYHKLECKAKVQYHISKGTCQAHAVPIILISGIIWRGQSYIP